MEYPASEVAALIKRGTQPDENFYRVKFTGKGETRWLNVSKGTLRAFLGVMTMDDVDDAERELSFATAVIDTNDPANLRWLARCALARADELES